MSPDIVILFAALVGAGLCAGFIGGLFGVGGGVLLVAALYHLYGVLGVADEVRMHAAIGASLSSIVEFAIDPRQGRRGGFSGAQNLDALDRAGRRAGRRAGGDRQRRGAAFGVRLLHAADRAQHGVWPGKLAARC